MLAVAGGSPIGAVVEGNVYRSRGSRTKSVAYQVRFAEGVAATVEFLVGSLSEEPRRVGMPLQRELTGYWSARRGSYRVVYRLDEDAGAVRAVRIEHRSDVYRRR